MPLWQNITQLVKDSATYGLVDFAGKSLALITVPIFTRVFAPQDYGVMSLLGMILGLAWPVLQMGMDCGVQLYFYREKDVEKRNGIIFSGLMFIVVWATFFSIVLILLNKPIAHILFGDTSHSKLVILVLVIAYLSCFVNYCKYLLRLGMEAWKFVWVTIAYNFLGVGIGLYLVLVPKLGIPGIYWGQLCSCFVALFLLMLWTRKYFSFSFSVTAVGKLLKVGIPYVPTALIYTFATYVDKICLSRMATLSEVGIYAVAMKLSNTISVLRGMFQMAWDPIQLKIYYDNEDYQRTYKAVMSGTLFLFCFAAVFITSIRREALRVFAAGEYFGAHAAVGPLCLAEAMRGCYAVALIGISITMKTYWMLIFSIISLIVNVLLNLVLIPVIGIAGAAIATSMSIALAAVLAYIATQRLVESIRFNWKVDSSVLMFALFAVGLLYLTNVISSFWLRSGANLIIVLAFPAILFVSGLVDMDMLKKGYAMARERTLLRKH